MGYRWDDFAPGEIYHVCTRGVEKRDIFLDNADRKRFLILLRHCLPKGQIRSLSQIRQTDYDPLLVEEGEGLVDLLAFCLMTNHFHLLLRENTDGGISLYMKRVLTSYACYFNKRYKRSGSLFLHPFKAVLIEGDDHFLHISRYIHLNPVEARITNEAVEYRWSSMGHYVKSRILRKGCHVGLVRSLISGEDYGDFVCDQADYLKSLRDVEERLFVDIED